MRIEPNTGMELLAPAGGFEAFKAAVENGADAVYLGGKAFNARASAANFDNEELREAIRYAHQRQVKVYVTVNILIADQEFNELIDYIYSLYETGVDAVILQDIGAAQMIHAVLPELEIHASTQMTVNNSWGVKLLERLGFKRAVLARENSAAEMKAITRQTSMEIEVFVHGALCVCYSGQCLMSSLIGGRSGNRGTCAQPCRMTYQLVNDRKEDVLAQTKNGEHLLSPRDLNLVNELALLQEAGVKSLKVEGRMKRPEYVATVIRIYRKALDEFQKQQTGDEGQEGLSEQDRYELMQIFNRDFTQGYIGEHPGAELMSYSRPNNRGTRLGRVHKSERGKLYLKLEAPLHPGDGIEIWTSRGREGITVDTIWTKQGKTEEGREGEIVELEFTGHAYPGDRVFKTNDAVLMEKARQSYQEGKEQRKRPLNIRLTGKVGEKMCLEAWDELKHSIVYSDNPAQIANKRPLTMDYTRQQLGRLGTTPFWLDQLELNLEGEIMIPVSELNEMRRKAVEELLGESLNEKITKPEYKQRVKQWKQSNLDIRTQVVSNQIITKGQPVKSLSVAVSDLEGVRSALQGGADRILLGGESWRSRRGFSLEDIRKGLELCYKNRAEGILRLPRITNQEQNDRWHNILEKAYTWEHRPVVMAANLGEIEIIKSINSEWEFEVDYSLNVFNEAALAYLLELGARKVTLSPELHHEQLRLLADWPKVEMMVFGDLEMMVSEYCPVGATLGDKKGKQCTKPCLKGSYFLKDRLRYDFPIETDVDCRMHLFNVKRLNLYEELNQIASMGFSNIRLQLTREDSRQIEEIVSLFKTSWTKASSRSKKGDRGEEEGMAELRRLFPEGFTKGHYFRGVL